MRLIGQPPAIAHPEPEQYRRRLYGKERYADGGGGFMEDPPSHFDVVLAAIAAGGAKLVQMSRRWMVDDEELHDRRSDLDG